MKCSLQEKILYIPFVNFCVIMFSWLKMYHKNHLPKIRFIKNTMKIFLYCFLFTIIRFLLDKVINSISIENIIFYFSVMIYMFIPSFIALKDQQKFDSEKDLH